MTNALARVRVMSGAVAGLIVPATLSTGAQDRLKSMPGYE